MKGNLGVGSRRRIRTYPDGRDRYEHHHERVTFPNHRPSPLLCKSAPRMGSGPLADSIGWVPSESQLRGGSAPVKTPGRHPGLLAGTPGLRLRRRRPARASSRSAGAVRDGEVCLRLHTRPRHPPPEARRPGSQAARSCPRPVHRRVLARPGPQTGGRARIPRGTCRGFLQARRARPQRESGHSNLPANRRAPGPAVRTPAPMP